MDGRLYTDDEPYWECLLEENKTYDVAYRELHTDTLLLSCLIDPLVRQPFGLGFLRLYDFVFCVPVFPAALVPTPDPRNCTSTRRAVLVSHGLISAVENRGSRKTLSDNADKQYGAWKVLIVQKGTSSYSQRMRRIVPGVPEIDYDAVVEHARGGGVGRFPGY